MSYLLIGNISALICDECIEPLAHARIRIYLPVSPRPAHELQAGLFSTLRVVGEKEYTRKEERLLASTTMDERGNFSLSWEQVHLFTEPLEIDIELARVPGQRNPAGPARRYHLALQVPAWKRARDKYVAAFAYVVPSENWAEMRADFGAGVVTGAVRHYETYSAMPGLRVEAYNALTDRIVGWGNTNEHGRYKLFFNIASGGPAQAFPEIYFKVYSNDQLVWSEDKDMAFQPERQRMAPCSRMNLFVKPASEARKAPRYFGDWLNDLMHTTKTKMLYKDLHVTA
ncbi:hypothetical protein MKQ68_08635 [Chitinophaga horti]|uniref:Uncharacterized protein n=1 Tax=Chitinophaga horti TaxID=2920382 RepID=A0ABY6J9Z3_9BACT|nr:hypothetical protein [Chitinophaga horti]UYQ95162.1 hypothetical protein MKQ68_08635 [Chitinophaga horti]